MFWNLSHAWAGEIVRARLIEKLGPERAAELEIRYPERNPVTLPQSIEFNRLTSYGILEAAEGPFLGQAFGSNGWVVSGNRTDTGAPILCNDMHLELQLPAIWYAVHLVAGPSGERLNVTGVSLPGVPMVMVGHNGHIAWGMTLAFTDCEDLFVEKLNPDAPHQYEFQGEWREAEVIHEKTPVKGHANPHIEEILVTHHGPIISDVVDHPAQRLAIQSMALQPCPAFEGWFRLNQARRWDDFVEAMRLIEAPQLNVPYADVDGNVGYWVTGRVPVRARGQGLVPAPGWTGEYEWIGEVPFEEMPHALNPAQGYIVSCNHRIVDDDYPHYLGAVWMNGYRARRIVDVFENRFKSRERDKRTLSFDDFRALHTDFHCIPGLELAARFSELSSSDFDVQAALGRLRVWDGNLAPDSVAGTLYEVTLYRLLHNLWEPALGTELLYQLLGEGPHPLLYGSTEFHGHATVTALQMLDNPDSAWVEDAGGRDSLLLRSFEEAVSWLKQTLGLEVSEWQWGRLHRASFSHALGIQPPLDRVFNRGPYPIGGDTDTPCLPRDPYDVKAWAPSYRQIVDMGDLSRSLMIFPPGQSGQVGSPHYDDLIEPWLQGEYCPMLWTREQVEQEAGDRLRLEPKDAQGTV
jgi:penicillin amidase